MYRESIASLKEWKEDKFRKPLIVRIVPTRSALNL